MLSSIYIGATGGPAFGPANTLPGGFPRPAGTPGATFPGGGGAPGFYNRGNPGFAVAAISSSASDFFCCHYIFISQSS